jgi:predicted RNase H-like HicB family nuclease
MLQYKAGYKYVDGGVHAQVVDFPAVISCADSLDEARRQLGLALLDVAETYLELGDALPKPDPLASDPEMDVEEPIYLHLSTSTQVVKSPAGNVAS